MAEGIGAQDQDYISAMPDVSQRVAWPWAEAGEVYAFAIREANDMRRRAFDNMPDFGTPRGTGPVTFAPPLGGAFLHERERGIPSW